MFETINDYTKSDKRKIVIFSAFRKDHYLTSSYIRLFSPLNELSGEFEIEVVDWHTRRRFLKDLDKNRTSADIIIISRDIDIINKDLKFVESLYEKLRENDIKIIFDIDDNIMAIDENHTEYEYYRRFFEYFKFLVRNSDKIIVSTPYLKESFKEYNDDIEVIENTLMNNWKFSEKCEIRDLSDKDTIKIGYFGTRTHDPDLRMLETPLKNIRKHFQDRNIEFEVVGITTNSYDWISKTIVPPNNYKNNPGLIDFAKNIAFKVLEKINRGRLELPYCQFIDWMKDEVDWDIGLAPLQDNRFNKNKSNLKYLEYTALNIPGIYSNVEPYKDIKDKNTGIVVDNNSQEWEEALISLIENRTLYKILLINSKRDIKENYLVENSSEKWRKVLRELL